MCLIDVPNLKDRKVILCGLKILQKQCKEEKCEENWAIFGSIYLVQRSSDFF